MESSVNFSASLVTAGDSGWRLHTDLRPPGVSLLRRSQHKRCDDASPRRVLEWYVGNVEPFLLPFFIHFDKIGFQVVDPGNLANVGAAAFACLIDVRFQPDAKLFAPQAKVWPAIGKCLAQGEKTRHVENGVGER